MLMLIPIEKKKQFIYIYLIFVKNTLSEYRDCLNVQYIHCLNTLYIPFQHQMLAEFFQSCLVCHLSAKQMDYD